MTGKGSRISEPATSDSVLWRAECSRQHGRFPSGIVVRPARVPDIDVIAKLAVAAFDGICGVGEGEYFRRKIANIMRGHYGSFIEAASFVACDQRYARLAGAILVAEYAVYGDPVVALVATHPACRRQGIGRALLYQCTDALSREGFQRCCANISRRNRVSSNFFASCDFTREMQGSSE